MPKTSISADFTMIKKLAMIIADKKIYGCDAENPPIKSRILSNAIFNNKINQWGGNNAHTPHWLPYGSSLPPKKYESGFF